MVCVKLILIWLVSDVAGIEVDSVVRRMLKTSEGMQAKINQSFLADVSALGRVSSLHESANRIRAHSITQLLPEDQSFSEVVMPAATDSSVYAASGLQYWQYLFLGGAALVCVCLFPWLLILKLRQMSSALLPRWLLGADSTIEPATRDSRNSCMAVPRGKEYAYFLSHTSISDEMCNCIHNALEDKGINGYITTEQSKEGHKHHVASAIAKSHTMIVILSDESDPTAWRLFEWEMAKKLDMPVKCVWDTSCGKEEVLKQIAKHPQLFDQAWLDWTQKNRSGVIEGLASWIQDTVVQIPGPEVSGKVSVWTQL